MKIRAAATLFAIGIVLAASVTPASAEKKYGPGVTDTEITLGQTAPFSGPVAFYAVLAKVAAAYFRMVNEHGGINGRTIKLIQLDDGYSPPKSVEMVRRLVEQDHVLAMYDPVGTAPNSAIRPYLNKNGVPQLFVSGGTSKWGDYQHFPWTMGWTWTYVTEAHLYARYILAHYPDAKIGILYQHDDFGREFRTAIREGLGDRADKMIVADLSYEVTDPTVDSQIISLSQSGANVFIDVTTPKFAVQAIRKSADLGWHPVHFIDDGAAFIGAVFVPAGVDRSTGIISANCMKDPTDPRWASDKGMQDWRDFMTKYYPDGNQTDNGPVYGYGMAMTMAQVIRQAGDDLTRENLMRQATNLKNFQVPILLPGVSINTSPTNHFPIKQAQLIQFDGKTWKPIGDLMSD